MAQGDILRLSNGKIALNATGKIRLLDAYSDCPDCCGGCTDSATSCSNCSGITPTTVNVLFNSGMSLCSCSDPTGGADDVKATWTSGNVINSTTHTLTQTSSCTWQLEIEDAIDVKSYNTTDGSCDAAYIDVDRSNDDLIIKLERYYNGPGDVDWVLSVYNEQSNPAVSLFRDIRNTSDESCDAWPGFTNDNSSCTGSNANGIIAATGGGATVSCP